MENGKVNQSRRGFLKSSVLAGGGLMLNFSWMAPVKAAETFIENKAVPEMVQLNGYIKIFPNNEIILMCPNPEFGQNVMTSLPMMVAEELGVDWNKIKVEMAPFDTKLYERMQFTGGSNGIKSGWNPLRKAGATARQMLLEAAAKQWALPIAELSIANSTVVHKNTNKMATFGELASQAALIPVPKEITYKAVKNFEIVGKSKKNVEGSKVVSGKPLFGLDYTAANMHIAMIVHPPAFGMKLKSFDATITKKMPGIKDVFTIKLHPEGFPKGMFDTNSFDEALVVLGKSTWEVMSARKKLKVDWENVGDKTEKITGWGGAVNDVFVPGALESSEKQFEKMQEMAKKPAKVMRKDGDPDTAFKTADKIIERTYNAPFLAHNCMEPMNFFADVTDTKAVLAGPLQIPAFAKPSIAKALGMADDKIELTMTRMGGGFGRRAYDQYIIEAAQISKKAKVPVKLVYTREDDMTYGIYRPMYTATYKAAFDKDKNLIAFAINGGGIPENPLHENRFPAGAIDNYLAEGWEIPSNVTIGAFRAPRSNFNAAAEQSFLDEIAEYMGKDPIDFRLELLEKAAKKPIGTKNDYDAQRYAEVLKLVKEKSAWKGPKDGNFARGVAAYFCHNSYAAHVVDMVIKDGQPYVERVYSAIDCGVVINPDAAINMVQGAVVDGIGNALYGNLSMKNGKPDQNNFHTYRMIRLNEAPKMIDVHFVNNEKDPTGLGEPPFPPVFGAIANAIYQKSGKRVYNQPYMMEVDGKI